METKVLLTLAASQYIAEGKKVTAADDQMGASAKRASAEQVAASRAATAALRAEEAQQRQLLAVAKQAARDRAREVQSGVRAEVAAFRDRMRAEQQSAAASRQALNDIKGSIFNLRNAIAGLGIAALARDLLQAAISSQQIKIGFDVAANSAAGGAAVYAHVREESYRLGLSLEETAKQYSSFAISARLAGLTAGETDTVFRGVAEAGTVLHLSAERMSLALLALEQAAGKGTVQMEELKRQLGNQIPGAVEIFANAMGVSVKKFYEMVKAGQVTAAELPKFGAELSKVFGPGLAASIRSAQAEMNRIKSTIFELRAAAGEGLLEGLAQGFSGLQSALGADELKAQAREIGKELGNALRIASEAAIFLAENIDKIKAALVLLLAVQAAGWLSKLGLALSGLSLSVNSLSYVTPLAARGLNLLGATAGTATLALGGIGIVLGAAAFAMQSYITSQSEAARVQQAELADSANVLRYLDQLRGRKEKLTAEEWSLAEAITARLKAEEGDANAKALKALYALNDAKREAAKVSNQPDISGDFGVTANLAAMQRVKELEQAYADAKGTAGGFRGELTWLDKELTRVGHDAKKTGGDTDELSKAMARAKESVEKQIRELQRLAEARKAGAAATLAGPQAVQIEERRAAIAEQLAKAFESMTKVKGGLDPSVAARLEEAAAAAYDAGKGLDAAKASVDRLRDSSASAREDAARLRDQLSGTATASQEVAARLQAEADTRGTVFDGIEAIVSGLAAENLARIQEQAAIDRQIAANQRERDSANEIADLQAKVIDARYRMTAASDDAADAAQILNLAIDQGATLFSKEWNAIVQNVQGHRARIKELKAEALAEQLLQEFQQRKAGLQAEFADWKERADAVKKYGEKIAGLLEQYGLLNHATRDLELREQARDIAANNGADLRSDKGREAVAVIYAQLKGYDDQLSALKLIQVQHELIADTVQPLKDAWADVGRQGQEVLVDWVVGADINFKEIAKSLEREMVSAILEVLRRWILAEYAKRAEAIKTAAIARAAAKAGGGGAPNYFGSGSNGLGSFGTATTGTSGTGLGVSGSTLAAVGFAAFAAYIIYKGFIEDTSELFASVSTTGLTQANAKGRSAIVKLQRLMTQLVKDVKDLAESWNLGLAEVGNVTLGRYGKKFVVSDIQNSVGRAFDSAEEAIDYAKVRAIQLAEVSDQVGLLVQVALRNSRATTTEGLKSDIDFARQLQSGGDDTKAKILAFVTDANNIWTRAVALFKTDVAALAQALAAAGQIEFNSWQSARDAITGRQRTAAEDLAIRQQQAVVWNAERQVRLANIALLLAQIKYEIALRQATVDRLRERGVAGGGGGGAGGGTTGGGAATSVAANSLFQFSQAVAGTAQVVASATQVIISSGDAQLDALRAQEAALLNLQNLLASLPPIDFSEIVPINRGGGGGTRADDAKALKEFFEQIRLSHLTETGRQLAEINRRFEEARKLAHGNADELARLNAERQHEIDLLKKSLKQRARDFIGKGGDLGASLRGIDDQAHDLITSYRELHDAGEITTQQLHQMVQALMEAADAQRQQMVQSSYSDVLISLLDATGKTNEAAVERWKLSVLEYQIKIAELKIAIEKYHLEGFNIGRLEDLLDEYIKKGPPTTDTGPGDTGPSVQDLYRQHLEDQRAAADKLRDDALALLRKYQEEQLDPFQRALRGLADDFQKIRAVFGNTAEVQAAYNAALMRIIENQVKPIEEWLNSVNLSDNAPTNAADRLAETQRQFNEVFAAVQGGQYGRIDELVRLADQLLGAQSAVNPQATQAYRDFYAALREQMRSLMEQIRAAGGAGVSDPGTVAVVSSLASVQGAIYDSGAAIVAAITGAGARPIGNQPTVQELINLWQGGGGGPRPRGGGPDPRGLIDPRGDGGLIRRTLNIGPLPPVGGPGRIPGFSPANTNDGTQHAVEQQASMINWHLGRLGGFTERTATAVERIARQGEHRAPIED